MLQALTAKEIVFIKITSLTHVTMQALQAHIVQTTQHRNWKQRVLEIRHVTVEIADLHVHITLMSNAVETIYIGMTRAGLCKT
jgi:hypothetical protein